MQGGKENEEGGAEAALSAATQTKNYFTLNLGTPDSLMNTQTTKTHHLCCRDVIASTCCIVT